MHRLFVVALVSLSGAVAHAAAPLTPTECGEKYPTDMAKYYECIYAYYGTDWYADGTGTCIPRSHVRPCAGEEDHWVALRFTPPATPFRVTEVRYALYDGWHFDSEVYCDASFEHNVQLLVGSSTTPDADPTVAASWSVSSSAVSPGDVVFTREVYPPVKLDPGDYLFVSIQNAGEVSGGSCGDTGSSTCVTTCAPGDSPGSDSFWSFAASPDYSWASLSSLGISWSPDVGVEGYIVE
jgi:hypothetical protein